MVRVFSLVATALGLMILGVSAAAQAPDIVWEREYPRAGGSSVQAMVLMPDGGFLMAGYTTPSGETYRDILLIRTDANGDTLFTYELGASQRGESAVSLEPTFDGGYCLTGPYNNEPPYTYNADILVAWLDATGHPVLSNLYGVASLSESPSGVVEAGDFAFVCTYRLWQNTTGWDVFVTEVNPLGGFAWTHEYDWPDADNSWGMIRTRDDGLLIWGDTQSGDAEYDKDIFLLKTTSTADSLWCRVIGSPEPWDESAIRVTETSDGGFLVCAERSSDTQPKDLYVVKTDLNGFVDWTWQYGSTYHETARCGIETSDGGYVVAGDWAADTWDNVVAKLDANGDTLWTTVFGDSSLEDVPYGIVETLDGGLVLAGTRSTGSTPYVTTAYLVKLGGDPAIDLTISHVTGLSLPVSDGSASEHTITISPKVREQHTEPLRGVLVHLDTLEHERTSDLVISLSHGGLSVTLADGAGGTGENFIGTVFSDISTVPIRHAVAPFTGLYIPEDRLGAFAGSDPSGDWTLRITDQLSGNDGVLRAWGISLLFDVITGIAEQPGALPDECALQQNFPNPFNPSTTIEYSLASGANVRLEVYNILGQVVRTLVCGRQAAGVYRVSWDGRDAAGAPAASGVYFYRLMTDQVTHSRKMMYLK